MVSVKDHNIDKFSCREVGIYKNLKKKGKKTAFWKEKKKKTHYRPAKSKKPRSRPSYLPRNKKF